MRISFQGMPGVRTNETERRFVTVDYEDHWVGMALSADWMRPSRCSVLTMAGEGRAMRRDWHAQAGASGRTSIGSSVPCSCMASMVITIIHQVQTTAPKP